MFEFLTFSGHHRYGLLLIPALIAVEIVLLRLQHRPRYNYKESATTALIFIGQLLSRSLAVVIATPLLSWLYQHRLADLPLDNFISIAALFLSVEFLYYWMHRSSHRLRWLWASHSVHHSSTRLNFSAAYRLGWTNAISGGWLFFTPLVAIGYNPTVVFGVLALNLSYQFFLHTETIGRLGPLEWVLNTPSHHRVHHAAEGVPLDRNFGGILIVFDRLFGTFAAEPVQRGLRYGLAGGVPSYNPFHVAFAGWKTVLADMRGARSAADIWRAAFGKP